MASSGHNSKLTPDEEKALKFAHYHAIQAAQEAVNAANAERSRVRKLAKADGIILSDIDFMMRCAEVDDATIVAEQLQREMEIASWFALPVQYQPDMFGDNQREPAVDRAAREGSAAGFAGKDARSPYGPGSQQDQAWMASWHHSQKVMRDGLQSAMEKKNLEKNPAEQKKQAEERIQPSENPFDEQPERDGPKDGSDPSIEVSQEQDDEQEAAPPVPPKPRRGRPNLKAVH